MVQPSVEPSDLASMPVDLMSSGRFNVADQLPSSVVSAFTMEDMVPSGA